MRLQYRQGDLLFVQQETPPADPLTPVAGEVIVAGEATGHAHRLVAGTILHAPNDRLYLKLTHAIQVIHEAHHPITLEAGLWLVVLQRKYTPQASRRVAD